MDQNPQNNTNNSQDLDSLLKEFQSLSATTPEKPVESAPNVEVTSVTQPVQQPNSTLETMNVVESQPNVAATPVNNVQSVNQQNVVVDNIAQVNPSASNVNSVNPQQPVQPTNPGVVQQPQSAPVIGAVPTPNPEVDMSVLNEKVEVYPGMNVTLNPNGEGTSLNNMPDNTGNNNDAGQDNNLGSQNDSGNNKSNLMFMVAIFLIIGAFILFIPKIDSFLKKKPGMEAKPTPTATAKPTNKPVADKDKEKTLTCTLPTNATANANTSTEITYKYYYKDGKITKLETTTNKKYLIVDDTTRAAYTVDQTNCGTLATTYANILGFAASCEEKDNTFIIKNSYDLANFVNPTTITINGEQKTLKSDVNYGDDINDAKELAETLGATCK